MYVIRKPIKACPGKGQGSLSESGCAIPFSPQDFCSPCEFVCRFYNTIVAAGQSLRQLIIYSVSYYKAYL